MSGDAASSFSFRPLDIPGVQAGSDKSIVRVGGSLYYLSSRGVCAWDGGYPSVVSLPLGIDALWCQGSAGTDGKRYYLSCAKVLLDNNQRQNWPDHFVYDPRFGTWHRTDYHPTPWTAGPGQVVYTFYPSVGESMYAIWETGYVMVTGVPASIALGGWSKEAVRSWHVKFPESTRAFKTVLTGSESKKGVLRLLIRCKVTGSMSIYVAYDGAAREKVGEITDGAKTSYVVPLILHRCDYWQLSMEGTGEAVIYSISAERYGGEWQQAEST